MITVYRERCKIALYKSFIFMPKGMVMTNFMKSRII